MLADLTGKRIAQGYNCFVRAGESAAAAKSIGFATSFNATESFAVQKATVLGHLGPIAIDPQDYDCQITIAAFVPSKKEIDNTDAYNEDVGTTIDQVFSKVSRSSHMSAAGVPNIGYLDFYNRKTGKILAKFTGVAVSSNGIQAEGNGYVRKNVQLMALDWPKD